MQDDGSADELVQPSGSVALVSFHVLECLPWRAPSSTGRLTPRCGDRRFGFGVETSSEPLTETFATVPIAYSLGVRLANAREMYSMAKADEQGKGPKIYCTGLSTMCTVPAPILKEFGDTLQATL